MSGLEQIVQNDLEKNGFSAPTIVADGKIHRFKRYSNDKKEDAWYVCFINKENGSDFLAGSYGDWRDPQTFTFCTHISLSTDKKNKIFKRVEKQFESEQLIRWEECSKDSQKIWDGFTLTDGIHAYLIRKKIQLLHGARLSKNGKNLLIPVQDFKGKMWGFQTIDEDGKKLFSSGTKKKGSFFALGEIVPRETVYLCEGFVTGCSIYEAIQRPVLVCFDAGNLVEVARDLRAEYPDCLLVVCGDNDVFTENNPGKQKAQEAAQVGMGTFVLPTFESLETRPTDFNDLRNLEGSSAVASQILGVEAKLPYVKCLGFKDQTYFYTSSDNLQVSGIESHSEIELLKLMPSEYWESQYPGKKCKIDWLATKSDLTTKCRSKGIFTKEMVRGHGVWTDLEKTIVHLGNRLFYDGKNHALHSLDSRHIYELEGSLSDVEMNPLTDKELITFRSILTSFNYSSSQQFMFLGGWMALAPICGALQWRPHIWLTGEPGSGKTTIKSFIENYLKNAFKGLFVVGATTEAGIRQTLRASAIPLVFDEFEPETKKNRDRIDGIMDLIRQASSEQDGEIIKGGANGSPNSYSPRFMSALSSVKPRLIAEADKSRFTYIELVKTTGSNDQWQELEKQIAGITPDFCKKLFARSLHNVKTTLKNIKTFQKALVSLGNSQRVGQQYGTLLAGFHSLESTSEISFKDAVLRAQFISINSEESISTMRDQEACLDFLLGSHLYYDNLRLTLANFIGDSNKHKRLEEYRMRLFDGDLWIAINNPQIDAIFANSKWDRAWSHVLKRLDGADPRKTERVMGKSMKGILIPRSYIQDESEEDVQTLQLAKSYLNP